MQIKPNNASIENNFPKNAKDKKCNSTTHESSYCSENTNNVEKLKCNADELNTESKCKSYANLSIVSNNKSATAENISTNNCSTNSPPFDDCSSYDEETDDNSKSNNQFIKQKYISKKDKSSKLGSKKLEYSKSQSSSIKYNRKYKDAKDPNNPNPEPGKIILLKYLLQ